MTFDFDFDMNFDVVNMKQILSIQKQSIQKFESINETSTTISNLLAKLPTISNHREFNSKKTKQIMKNLIAKQKKIKIIMIKMSKSTTNLDSHEKLSKFKSYKSINQSFNINTNINSDSTILSNSSMSFNFESMFELDEIFKSKAQFFFELFQKKSNTIKNTNSNSMILFDSKSVRDSKSSSFRSEISPSSVQSIFLFSSNVERTQSTTKTLTKTRNLHAEKKRFFTKFDSISRTSSKINDEN